MPNTGRPSRDCHLCRQRRVKCDLARPQCQRCTKYGTQCPGYRDEQDLLFKNENPVTVITTRRGKSKKAAAAGRLPIRTSPPSGSSTPTSHAGMTPSTASVHDEAAGRPRVSVSSQSSSLPAASPVYAASPSRELKEGWRNHSVPLLLSCYADLTFLSDIYKDINNPDDPLLLATHLWSRAYLTNNYHAFPDRRETALCLGNTLRSVSLSVQNRRRAVADSTVLAVWMLGLYEIQIGGLTNRAAEGNPWHVHAEGLMSLTRARGTNQLHTQTGRAIFWTVYTIIQSHCLMTNTPCPPETGQWFDILATYETERDDQIAIGLSRYIYRACSMLHAIFPIVFHGRFDEAYVRYDDFVAEVESMEQDVAAYHQGQEAETPVEDPIMEYFWHFWRSARIRLHHFLILLSNFVEFGPGSLAQAEMSPEERRQKSYATVASTAKGIMAGVPAAMKAMAENAAIAGSGAWFDGMRLIWPLTNVYTIRTVPKHLRVDAKNALVTIATHTGILQALMSRPGIIQFPEAAIKGLPYHEIDETDSRPDRVLTG